MKSKHEYRILEVGHTFFLSTLVPGQTTKIWSSHFKASKKGVKDIPIFSPSLLWKLYQELQTNSYDLIAINPPPLHLWRAHKWFFKNILDFLRKLLFHFEYFGVYLVLKLKSKNTPAIVLDTLDTMIIPPQCFGLFADIQVYFKRELPQNNWHAFLFTTPKNEDVSNIRRQKFFQKALAKVRPLPLLAIGGEVDVEWFPEKEFEIFYVGENPKTTVRMRGYEILKKLAASGLRVDIPEQRINPEEFKRRCQRAWLVWSPEGSGWDCVRHYESLIHGAVPIINYPTIERYKPLLHGEHCFYYGVEEDHLAQIILQALQDKARLRTMIRQGRKHLNAHFTNEKLWDYVLQEVLREEPPAERIL